MFHMVSTRTPQVLFCKAAFQLGGSLPGPWGCPRVQDFALLLVELHEVCISPFLQLVKVRLDSSRTLWLTGDYCFNCFTLRFLVSGKKSIFGSGSMKIPF